MSRAPKPAAPDMFGPAPSDAERDNAYADAAVAKVAGIATTADLWRAVDAMMDRRATMTISASQRISDAIHRRYEQLTGRTISGAPVAKDAA